MSPPSRPLRVVVVDDSALYRKIVRDVLAETPGVEVVGVANNGRAALERIEAMRPDVVTLDLEMPVLDGIGVLHELSGKPGAPLAIVVSAFSDSGAAATTMALQEGAFDFLLKPATKSPDLSVQQLQRDLGPKLRACRARLAAADSDTPRRAAPPKPQPRVGPTAPAIRRRTGPPEVIGVGVSTGGPQALSHLLPKLPADLPCPIVIVQHMPPMFTGSLARDLDHRCQIHVAEAEDGQPLRPGEALIAPGGKQMRVAHCGDGDAVIQITDDPPERNCKPAVDYLFRSLADTFERHAVGVVLTGMGDDGTAGCEALRQSGGRVWTQDEASCVVYGMPRSVVDAGLSEIALPLDQIADRLVRLTKVGAVT